MANQKMSLPGMTSESTGLVPKGTINIDLDDQSAKYGRAINFEVFKRIVSRYNKPHNHRPHLGPRPNECVAFVIDKQLLHTLMASEKCRYLLLARCLRPKKTTDADEDPENPGFVESLSFMALKHDHTPVGTIRQGKMCTPIAGSDVSAGEWIQGFTHAMLVKYHIIDPLNLDGDGFDFDKLFEDLDKGQLPSVSQDNE